LLGLRGHVLSDQQARTLRGQLGEQSLGQSCLNPELKACPASVIWRRISRRSKDVRQGSTR
jgi:hypothetical protein